MAIAALIQLLLPLLANVLGTEGVIPGNLSKLIVTLGAAIPTLIEGWISGTPSDRILATLKAIQQEVDALKATGTLFTLNQANIINALDSGISDAVIAYEASLKVTDPSTLTPLPENL